ncbi:hypothetical protein KVT40_005612 [Elsinoe batatas]|uniref:Dockerin type 1 n=1 Tax=Elsinoe batatas TaxID=2601811 RepID=A0A8K0L049_9PEZI|nr:hypothetical protein KVT40_005612 [Elsinoe batatas]
MHLSLLTSLTVLLAGLVEVSAQAAKTYKPAPVPSGKTYYGQSEFSKLAKTKKVSSTHFRVYNTTAKKAAQVVQVLEGAYDCFVNDMGFADTGVSIKNSPSSGPYWKSNIFTAKTDGVAGFVTSDWQTGLAYMVMDQSYVNISSILVHEYGHILTYHAVNSKWWMSSRASGWAEPLANFFSEIYHSSSFCASARSKANAKEGWTLFTPQIVIGASYLSIIDATRNVFNNEYQSWPFIHYLTMNIDKYPNLGRDMVRTLFNTYNSTANETPFHTLQRLVGPSVKVQKMLTKYWARMAYIDFADTKWYTQYYYTASSVSYDNLDYTSVANTYRVQQARQPKYLGASIIPLVVSGTGQNTIRVTGNMPFSATLSILGADRTARNVRYVNVPAVPGKFVKAVKFALKEGEDATLTVVNTPRQLLTYDTRATNEGDVAKGLDFTVKMNKRVQPRGRSWVGT